MGRVKENQQTFYVCGQCQTKIFHLKTEEPEIPCPDCGWAHGTRKPSDVSSVVKLDLNQY